MELTREQAFHSIYMGLAQVMTQEQFTEFKRNFMAMSDYEFQKVLAVLEYCDEHPLEISVKDLVAFRKEMKKRNNVTDENSALHCCPVTYLGENTNRMIWDDICKSKPSDYIHMMGREDTAICELWKNSGISKDGSVPSDLFFAGTVPLLDCDITVDERDVDKENGRVCSARVVVFEDYRDRIKNAGGSLACVGAVVTVQGDQTSFVPMMVCEGVDSIMLSDYGWHNISKEQREYMSQNMSLSGVLKYAVLFLNTWYGIQIALLHPTVRTIFSHPRTEAVKKHQKSKKRKRVTRYVKKHIIRYEDIQTAMYGNHKNTLVWYVIGHWRHYTNGKKVFVQPYWKGTLRELKMNLDDRKRIVGGTL